MALDTQDIKLINEMQNQMEERLVDAINGQGSRMRAKIESEVDRIDEMDKLRNGRIGRNEDDIEIMQCETRITRWAHRNPKTAIIGIVIFIASIAIGAYSVNVKRTIEKIIPIELKNETEDRSTGN